MHPNPQQRYTLNNTECCFAQFFSQNSSQDANIKKNPSGLINPYQDHKSIFEQNQLVFQPKTFKPQFNSSKRSISNIKANKRMSNRCSYENENNRYLRKDQSNMSKVKNPLRGSEAIQRYFSPNPQLNATLSRSQLDDKKKISDYFNAHNIQNSHQYLQEKPHTFFKKEKLSQPIQFTRHSNQSNSQLIETSSANVGRDSNLKKADKSQNINKNVLKPYLNAETAINIIGHEKKQQKNCFQQSFSMINSQRDHKPTYSDQQMQNLFKQQNSIQKNHHDSIDLKLHEQKTCKQSTPIKPVALEQICQMSKEQSRHQSYLQKPINPFQHIESFVMQVQKEIGQTDEHKKQFDSIKTKGRPVQSMLQMTKDLTKTRKNKKPTIKRQQTGLNDLENMTVTSEFDEDQKGDGRQRIQESAVLLNFFNPPTHLRDRMEISRANKQVYQDKSGFD